MDKGCILIVDDEPNNLRLLAQLLEYDGYETYTVESGLDALTMLDSIRPDLILLDISMPKMDGFEVCERLKTRPDTKNTPVIFVSALQQIFDKMRAFRAGGVDYITKPFQSNEILIRVKTHIELQRTKQKLQDLNNSLEKDIHDRTVWLRQALYDAKHYQSQIKAVFDNVVDGIVVTNAYGIIQTVNPAMETIFGYTHTEMIGQNVTMLMPTDYHNSHKQYVDRYRQAGRSVYHIMGNNRELVGLHKDGRRISLLVTLSDFEFDTERILTAIIRDITAEKAAIEAVRQADRTDDLPSTFADGIKIGIAEGRKQTLIETTARVITFRFQTDPHQFEQALSALSLPALEHLNESVFTVSTLTEFEALLNQNVA